MLFRSPGVAFGSGFARTQAAGPQGVRQHACDVVETICRGSHRRPRQPRHGTNANNVLQPVGDRRPVSV